MVANPEPIQPLRRPRGRRTWISKALCWLPALAIGLLIGKLAYEGVKGLVGDSVGPIVYGGAVGEESNAGEYVLPLIDRNQQFDVALTVWVTRAAEAVGEEATRRDMMGEGIRHPQEFVHVPLFSDVVFRGLKLTDKGIRANASFELPTERFRDRDVAETDLRGTFTLMPSSPSPLDQLDSYTNYRDSNGKFNPPSTQSWEARAWPFPLSSPERERTLVDRAVDTMSVTIPLIKSAKIPSRCKNASLTRVEKADTPRDSYDEEDMSNNSQQLVSHPHIITRAQIVVVDETRPIRMDNFTQYHTQLSQSENCMPSAESAVKPNHDCRRNYTGHGHWETMFYTVQSLETTIEARYSPYIDVVPGSYNYKDVVPIPVIRENCTDSNPVSDKGVLDNVDSSKDFAPITNELNKVSVTLKLSFSGRSYAKYQAANFLDSFVIGPQDDDNFANESDFTNLQDLIEVKHGVGAHWYRDDLHPRRIFGIEMTRTVLWLVLCFLDLYYWYSLRTTTGVTMYSSALFAGVYFLSRCGIPLVNILLLQPDLIGNSLFFIYAFYPALMVRALGRIDVEWRGWYPHFRQVPFSHRERRSQRLDRKLPWEYELAAVILVAFSLYQLSDNPYWGLKPRESASSSRLTNVLDAFGLLEKAAYLVMELSQFTLNERNATFAGQYRPAALLRIFETTLGVLVAIPMIVGNRESPNRLSTIDMAFSAPRFLLAWQALRLASVQQDEEEDNE